MDFNDFPAPHIPSKLPNEGLQKDLFNDKTFISKIIKQDRKLAEFIGYLQNLPNPEVLITSLTLQEAVLSSRIEGTIATAEDVVNDNTSSETIKNDIVEINNYCNAIEHGYNVLRNTDRGMSKNLIKELHILLLENNVRGATKTPGEFKSEQNFIRNDLLGNFTPLPPILTDEYIDNLVSYIENGNELLELIQAAIMHAQFEMIHPFKDGNGRVGRLLIPLFLFYKGVIPRPIFYISRYFADHDDDYKLHLGNISKVTTDTEKISAWKAWISFFFDGVAEESARHIETSQRIIALHNEMLTQVVKTDMLPLIYLLFKNLKVEPKDAVAALNLPQTSVYKELRKLAADGYLTRTGSDRKTLYVFTKLINIIR